MIWFFERGVERIQCEIRQTADGCAFELAWTTPDDGKAHIERSEDASALDERRKQLESSLTRDGWKRVGRVTPDKRFL